MLTYKCGSTQKTSLEESYKLQSLNSMSVLHQGPKCDVSICDEKLQPVRCIPTLVLLKCDAQ